MDDKKTAKEIRALRDFRRRTDVEKTGNDLLSSEAELRIAIEATGLGIVDYYPLEDQLHWSDRVKEHFGLSADAHVNYNVFLVGLHAEDRERVDRLMHYALQRENGGRYETEYRTVGIEDGRERWIAARGRAFFNQEGEAVRLIGTTLDITDRKRAEEALRESREQCRLLFDKSPVPKWLIDLENLSFCKVNEAALEYYGYGPDEFRKLKLADIMTAGDSGKFEQWMKEGRSSGERMEGSLRMRHRRKNNETVDVKVRYTEILYEGRKTVLAVILSDAVQEEGQGRV